jgi:energy-coupling factor transporter ATP-binding protein EcfA2
MSELILTLGASGSGKSSAVRNMNPESTLMISVDGKRPPFSMKGWELISKDNPNGSFFKPPRHNVYSMCKRAIEAAIKNGKKTIIVDDSQFLLANTFFDRAEERGYDKFSQMGKNFWQFIEFCRDQPDDVTIYFLHHLEYTEQGHIKPKTIGKMLDQQGCVEGRFTICLLAEKVEDEHVIRTSMSAQPVVKAPMGMFEEEELENDLQLIDQKVREYYGI